MRNHMIIASFALGFLVLAAYSGATLTAVAHEGHQAKCDETAMNALEADIQSMDDGEAKTTAIKEMELAQEMMEKNDVQGCETHIHKAMEALEE
ncbi:MAG: hypothetical protein ACREDO_00380 [Methyloceanibacter sp.]